MPATTIASEKTSRNLLLEVSYEGSLSYPLHPSLPFLFSNGPSGSSLGLHTRGYQSLVLFLCRGIGNRSQRSERLRKCGPRRGQRYGSVIIRCDGQHH